MEITWLCYILDHILNICTTGYRPICHFFSLQINEISQLLNTSPSVTTPSTKDQPDDGNTPILIGCLVTIILLLVVIIFLILWCQYVCKVLEKVGQTIFWIPTSVITLLAGGTDKAEGENGVLWSEEENSATLKGLESVNCFYFSSEI